MTIDLDVGCHLSTLAPDASPERLPAVLGGLAELGFRRLVLPPLDPDRTDVPRLRALCEHHGITPIAFAGQRVGADVSAADADERAAGVAELRAALDLAERLGADQLNGVPYGVFGPPAAPTDPAAVARSALAVGRVADEAADRGVLMCFEVLNRYETSAINTAAQAVEYVALSGSRHLRIHLDTFHMSVEETDLLGAVSFALPWLGYLELGQSGRGALEPGTVDNAAVVARALAEGYRGRLGVEAFSRAVLTPADAAMRFIWRETYSDGLALAADGIALIRRAAGV